MEQRQPLVRRELPMSRWRTTWRQVTSEIKKLVLGEGLGT